MRNKFNQWAIGLATCAALLCAVEVKAQTTTTISPVLGTNALGQEIVTGFTTNTEVTPTTPSTNTWTAALKTFGAALENFTNIAVTPYGTYASSHPAGKSPIGGGVFITYNVNNYVGAGLGIDYMGGNFSALSGTVTLKLPQTFTFGSLTFTFVPFVLASVGTPLGSGNTGSVTTRTGGGAYLQFGHWLNGQFVVGALVANVTGAGDYSGMQTSLFAGWKKGF